MTRKAATAAVIISATGLIAGGSSLGNAAPTHHRFTTVHYTARTVSVEKLDRLDTTTNVRLRSRHVARAGSIQGAAEFTCHRKTPATTYEHCRGALALKQGMMYVNARVPFSTYKLSGKITGGSGVYKGAKGHLVAVIGDTKHASLMTIRYRL